MPDDPRTDGDFEQDDSFDELLSNIDTPEDVKVDSPVSEEQPVEEQPTEEQPIAADGEEQPTEQPTEEKPVAVEGEEQPTEEVDYKALYEKQQEEFEKLKKDSETATAQAELNKKRLELFEKLQPKEVQPRTPAESTTQQEPQWIDPVTYNDFLGGDPVKANAAVNNLFEAFYHRTVERINSHVQQSQQVQDQSKEIVDYFFEANSDLTPHKEIVDQYFKIVASRPQNRGRNILDILNDVATESRNWITKNGSPSTQPANGDKKVTLVSDTTPKPVRNFGESGRSTQRAIPEREKLTEQQKDMIDILEE